MAGLVQAAAEAISNALGLSGPDEPAKKAEQGQETSKDLAPAPAGPEEHKEQPGEDPATITRADNAGIESQGAAADEGAAAQSRKGQAADITAHPLVGAASASADDGDTIEGALSAEGTAPEQKQKQQQQQQQQEAPIKSEHAAAAADNSTKTGAESPAARDGDTVEDSGAEEPTAEPATSGSESDAAPLNVPGQVTGLVGDVAADSKADAGAADSKPEQAGGATAAAGTGQGESEAPVRDADAVKDEGRAPEVHPEVHQQVLEKQEQAGKIFHLEPVMPGAGATVHGMLPAPILMHTAENTKRTGGSPKDAVTGVEEAPEDQQLALEDKMGNLEVQEPGAPVTAAQAVQLPEDTTAQ